MHVLQNCVGAVDSTHISCTPVALRQDAYWNRHGYFPQNVLDAYSFDMLFTYMLAGWESSAHDTYMLNSALDNIRNPFPRPPPSLFLIYISGAIYHNMYITVKTNGLFKNAGKYLLVDSGYPNSKGFIPPYRAMIDVSYSRI